MIGETISHYRIVSKLGEGGMGEVYLADDTQLNRKVALKFLPRAVASDAGAVERFKREAQAAAALSHANIVTIYEVSTRDERPFIAMAYVKGAKLSEWIDTGPRERAVVALATQIADGLSAAHKADIVHRDIKPDNIVVDAENRATILDFGLAKLEDVTKLTAEGSTIGTYAYMSPEQTRGEEADHRSDIFSFGVVLYEMLAGQRPFRGDHQAALVYSIANEEPTPLRRYLPDVSDELERIVNKAIAKDPKDRYQSMADLHGDIDRMRRAMDTTPGESQLTATASGPAARASGAAPIEQKRGGHARTAVVAVLVLAGFWITTMVAKQYFPSRDANHTASDAERVIESIAVLPLDNFSGPGEDYFADGMTEAVIADLAKIKALRVISRTSVMRYKNTEKSLPEIANELGVQAILEGSVQKADDRVRVTVQLIDAATDEHLWAESYDRDARDVLSLQSQVAADIAKEVHVQVTAEESSQLAADKLSIDPRAFEAYARGRAEWHKRTQTGLETAVREMTRAIELAPNYARGYVGLADAIVVSVQWEWIAPEEGCELAKRYALRALELDPTLGEAYAVLGGVYSGCDRNWVEGIESYEKCTELAPGYATGHQWLSEAYWVTGQVAKARRSMEAAGELDPHSLIVQSQLGYMYSVFGEADRGLAILDGIVAKNPEFGPVYLHRGLSYEVIGEDEEWARDWSRYMRFRGATEAQAQGLLDAFTRGGKLAASEYLVNTPGSTGVEKVAALSRLGRMDEAFAAAFQAIEDVDLTVDRIATINDGSLDRFHTDPRYQEFLRKINMDMFFEDETFNEKLARAKAAL